MKFIKKIKYSQLRVILYSIRIDFKISSMMDFVISWTLSLVKSFNVNKCTLALFGTLNVSYIDIIFYKAMTMRISGKIIAIYILFVTVT